MSILPEVASIPANADSEVPSGSSPAAAPVRMPRPHRLSLQQYHAMIDQGILTEQDTIEFIHGQLVEKMVIGNRHAACVKGLNRLFSRNLPEAFLVSVQDPIRVLDSEPETDVAILHFREDLFATRRPTANDVALLIEVADTSIAYDRDVKGPLYAAAGIAEYWIINLNHDTVEVHRNPRDEGRYGSVETLSRGQSIRMLKLSEWQIDVDTLVGPPAVKTRHP